jgi:putative cell wall-binding protein
MQRARRRLVAVIVACALALCGASASAFADPKAGGAPIGAASGGAALDVRLVDEAMGTPLSGGGMAVEIQDASSGATLDATVDTGGRATFTGLAVGSRWTIRGVGGQDYVDGEYWQAPNGSDLYTVPATSDEVLTIPRRHAPGSRKDALRKAGATRYETALELAKEYFPGWRSTTDVIVACGDDAHLIDALAAGPLSGAYDCPMLLVQQNAIPQLVDSALRAMPNGLRVHIVGSEAAISRGVKTAIEHMPNVEYADRIEGADRYETAAQVARVMKAQLAPDFVQNSAFIVNGEDPAHFWDALSASAPGYNMDIPILLVTDDTAPAATKSVMTDLGLTSRYVIGGPAAVPEPVRVAAGVPAANRIAGPTRYATARAVAEYALANKWVQPFVTAVAATIPDALSAGAMIGSKPGVLLLTEPDASSMQADTRAFLTSHKSDMDYVFVCGASNVIPESARLSLMADINR